MDGQVFPSSADFRFLRPLFSMFLHVFAGLAMRGVGLTRIW
jgi:hypothetical protein